MKIANNAIEVEITMSIELVTPEKAEEWLKNCNTHNRKMPLAEAMRIARDIINGKWIVSHQGIAFDVNGTLLDGQTRLKAITIAKRPASMPVWRNLPTSVLEVTDTGQRRNAADVLTLSSKYGHVNKTQVATVRAMAAGFNPRSAMTDSEIGTFLMKHREAINFSDRLLTTNVKTTNGVVSALVRAAVARAYYSQPEPKLKLFCEMLTTGLVQRSIYIRVIKVLRDYLSASNGDGRGYGRRVTPQSRYGRIERAILAVVRDEPLKTLYPVTSELFPLPEEIETLESNS